MRLSWPSDKNLRWINWGLLAVIVGCNAYVLLSPLWPQVTFAVDTKISKPVSVNLSDDANLLSIDRSYNHVVIPKLQLDEKIVEGTAPETAHLGVWRRPLTAKPGENSNTVLVGHRFTYDGASVFYHLDKLGENDKILVAWEGKLYVYNVFNEQIVQPEAISIEAPSSEERLTIYTCTPLWSVQQRLVISAELERVLP